VTGNVVPDSGTLRETGATPHGDGGRGNPVCGTSGARFDGVDDFYDFGSEDWNWGGTVSFAMYVKYDRFFTGNGVIFDFGTVSDNSNTDSVLAYNIAADDITDNSRIAFQINHGADDGPFRYTSEGNFEELTWTHVVLTVSGSTMKAYKNGALVDTNTEGWEPRMANRNQCAIGTYNGGSNPDMFFDGTIAHVQMWFDVELSQSDVTELYEPHNIVHHFWDFRGCFTGSPAIDSMTGDLAAMPIGATCSSEGMVFDGYDDYVDFDHWGWGGAVSIEIFFKFDSFQAWSTLFQLGNAANYDDSLMLYAQGVDPSLLAFVVYERDQYDGMWGGGHTAGIQPFELNTWTHMVMTVDGDTGDEKLYRNGELEGSKSGGYVPPYNNRNAPSLGMGSGYFHGTIGFFKVSHVELSATAIRAQYYCPSGYYGNLPSGCTVCPTGKYSGYPSTISCYSCEAGKSTTTGTSAADHDSPMDCTDCAAGEYSEAGSHCTICPPGTYSGSTGSSSCDICPSGRYLSDQATSSDLHNSISSCRECSAGKKLSDNALDASEHDHPDDCETCNPGFFAGSGAPSCTECEAGKSSPAGASACSTCPSGYVCGETNEPCPTGKYSNGDTDGCESCEAGYSCPGGTDRSQCFPGSYQPHSSQSTCLSCEAGKYQENPGQDTCVNCPVGHFCPERTVNPIACGNVALFCPANSDQVSSVDEGHYTTPPTVERELTRDSQTQCEVGYACVGGKRLRCDGNGEYSDEVGLKACKIAPAGKKPTSDHRSVVNCDAGSYSVGNANACLLCESGKTSNAGAPGCSTCTTCAVGKRKVADCSPGEETVCEDCTAGKASMGGDATSCTECSSGGLYSDTDNASFCKTAPAGKKPTGDRQGVEVCPAGTFSTGAVDACNACGPGETSDAGAAGCRTCATCGLGKYQIAECTSEVETQCGDCVAGKASMGGAVSECTRCDKPGEYSEAKASVCKTAPAGYKPTISDDGLKTGIEMCPKNTFSIGAADECTNCADGGHSNPGDSACEQCLTGKYFDEPSNKCEECPANTHSSSGATTRENCEKCDTNAGEYSYKGAGYCSRCPQYEVFSNQTNVCECIDTFTRGKEGTCTCKAGHTLMGTTCQPCEKAKWKAEEGVVSCNLCSDMIQDSTTEELGSITNSSCMCPPGKYNNMNGKCEKVMEGIDESIPGMTLASMEVQPEWWRTGSESIDIRECPVPEACVGGNRSDDNGLCLEGHSGPYCNLCEKGFAKDPFLICKECDVDATSVALSILLLIIGILAVAALYCVLKKKLKDNAILWKRLKNGAKILLVGFQITASLPAVVPALPLPENFKEAVRTFQFLNADLFQFVSAGCWSGEFNFYHRALAVTLPVLFVCGLLVLLGKRSATNHSYFFNVSIAISYLTLPAITTTIFGVFSCDELDDDRNLLRTDYSISCDDEMRNFWLFYGVVMVLTFPVGVSAVYFRLLYMNREKIRQTEEVRELDEELMNIAFLFDPYKPEYWYFEVVETMRRLLMTGALSSVRPGSFTQLSCGLSLSIFFTVLLATLMPYSESRDNWIAILSSALLIMVFLASSFMKYNQNIQDDSYDANGMDVLLMIAYLFVLVLFFWWAFFTKDDLKPSATALAKNTLKGSFGSKNSGMGSRGASQESLGEEERSSKGWLGPIGRIGSYLKERERASYEKKYIKKPKADLKVRAESVGAPPPPRRDENGVEMRVVGGGWDGSLLSVQANPLQGGAKEVTTVKVKVKPHIARAESFKKESQARMARGGSKGGSKGGGENLGV